LIVLDNRFGGNVTISGAEAGLHFTAAFCGVCFTEEQDEEIEDRGITNFCYEKAFTLSYDTTTPYDNALIFGYGNTKIEDMEAGTELLSSVIKQDDRYRSKSFIPVFRLISTKNFGAVLNNDVLPGQQHLCRAP
jgi:DNA-binding transcriptional MocR family regulator